MSTTTATTQTSAGHMMLQQRSQLDDDKYAIEFGSAFRLSDDAARTTLINLAQRFLRFNHAVFTYIFFGSTIAALQSYLFTKHLTMRAAAALANVARTAWNSKQSRRLQKKVEFEFFVLILGCGNSFCLVVFWPGWILIGLVYLLWTVLRCWAG